MRGRSMLPRRESPSGNKVDLLILIVMVALFLLTMTITFSPANFPSREYEDMNPVIPHLVGIDEDTAVQDAVDRERKAEAESSAREEAKRRAEEESRKKRREEEDREQRRKEAEERQQRTDEEQREEEERMRADEEQRRQAAEEKKKQEEEQEADEEQRRQAAEEAKVGEERIRADEEQRRQAAEDAKKKEEEALEQDPERVAFLKQKAQEMEDDKQNYAARRTLMSKPPQMLGDEWENKEEEQCSQEDCPWKGAYLLGKEFRPEKAGCDPRSRQCQCLEHWGGKKCPKSFPEEKQLTIAASGWILDFMGQYVEGQYSCPHSAPRVVNFKTMTEDDNPDIYLSADVPFVKQVWEEFLKTKHAKNKPNSKTALLYVEAEPHVGHWFTTLPELDISLTFYNWADIHVSHIQDHPSWFRNSPLPFHQKRNITFINTGCYGHRTAVVQEFMKYVHVENLGACLKNADYCELFPYCCRTPFHGSYTSRYVEKECLIHHYKFVLALENNAATYNYTTEKFWQPMKMGTVPIYWGNNSSKVLVPGDHPVIRVDDFPTIKDAAMYLKELMEDEDKYNKHLEWKWKPFRKEFLVEADHALSTFVCRLADAYKQGQTFYGSKKMPGYAGAKAN